jgi:signal transduction histidine kinase
VTLAEPVEQHMGECMIVAEMESSGTDRPDASRSRGAAVESAFSAIHDLGNLIQVASSGMNILARNPDVIAAPSLWELVGGARTALERASTLVRNTIARGDERQRNAHLANVGSCLAEIQRLVGIAWSSSVRLEVLVSGELPALKCDYQALQSALLNLLFNARDAMPDGGVVSIEAVAVTSEQAAMVEFRVNDKGIGMTPDTVFRAFEPFFTTKGQGLGGIGLPSVKQFADEHSGSIDIQSVFGSGTTVTLRLPAAH